MAQQRECSPASHTEIHESLIRYVDTDVALEIAEIVDSLRDGQSQEAAGRLAALDARIGGFGTHSLTEAEETEV
jgi:hypothetical protein